MNIIDYRFVKDRTEKRNPYAHKGDFGRTLIIAGSYGMAGAAIIASQANIRSGVGICDIYCQNSIYPILAGNVIEAVYTPYEKPLENIETALNKADCTVIGCGMGKNDNTKALLSFCLQNSKNPLIIDADALNCLADDVGLLKNANCPVILTPHIKEMSRLIKTPTEEIIKNRVNISRDFALKYNVTLVLKGHNTLVTLNNGEQYVNMSGNAGMATGGSGDMLCGIMGALVCRMSLEDAVCSSVFIHGAAGDVCACDYSQTSTCPTLMLQSLTKIFKKLEQD